MLESDQVAMPPARGRSPTRLDAVRRRIAAAAHGARAIPADIRLVAVSKTFRRGRRPRGRSRRPARLRREPRAGRPRQRSTRCATSALEWHLIGHLQSNKARKAVAAFHMDSSRVDSVELLRKLDAGARGRWRAAANSRPGRSRARGDEVRRRRAAPSRDLVHAALDAAALDLRGLMIVPPFPTDPEDSRPWFRRCASCATPRGRAASPPRGSRELSMGMSHDFEVAIDEGATMVRVGTAIFGTGRTAPPAGPSMSAQRDTPTLLIEHLDQLYTCAGPAPRAGARQGDVSPIADGAVAGRRRPYRRRRHDGGGPRGDHARAAGRRRSTAAAIRSCPGFVDGTHARRLRRRSARRTCGAGSAARRTRRSRRPAAAFCRRCEPRARPAKTRSPRRREAGSPRCSPAARRRAKPRAGTASTPRPNCACCA